MAGINFIRRFPSTHLYGNFNRQMDLCIWTYYSSWHAPNHYQRHYPPYYRRSQSCTRPSNTATVSTDIYLDGKCCWRVGCSSSIGLFLNSEVYGRSILRWDIPSSQGTVLLIATPALVSLERVIASTCMLREKGPILSRGKHETLPAGTHQRSNRRTWRRSTVHES